MQTMTTEIGGTVFRWTKGPFIAVWNPNRPPGQVPDDLIRVPESVDPDRATDDDLRRIAAEYRR